MSEKNIVRYSADEIRRMVAAGKGRTNLERLDSITDEEIEAQMRDDPDWADFMDIDWSKATIVYPVPKNAISIRLDKDVIDFFKATGKGYQTRINAVLRRSTNGNGEELIQAEGLVLDAASHRVTVGERTVQLGPTEYRLLSFFMTHAERVYSRAQLLDRVWGGNVYVEERTVDVHIRRLRKALEAFNYDRFIQTVRGSGYRFSTRTE